MTGERSPGALVRDLVAAFAAVDPEAMGAVLADDVVAHITNAAGGSDVISGRDELVSRLGAFDYGSAELSLAGGTHGSAAQVARCSPPCGVGPRRFA